METYSSTLKQEVPVQDVGVTCSCDVESTPQLVKICCTLDIVLVAYVLLAADNCQKGEKKITLPFH